MVDITKYVSLTIGVAVIAIIIGVMGPIIADNLLPTATSSSVTAVLSNAGTINTLIQLCVLFVPIILVLVLVRGAMSKS